jgi:hypothetical protein
MAEPTLEYRIWCRGMEWHWEVISEQEVLASGVEESSTAARVAAFQYCRDAQDRGGAD